MSWPADGLPRYVVAGVVVLDRAFCHRIVFASQSKRTTQLRCDKLNAEAAA